MPQPSLQVSAIIPAYNEEGRIAEVIRVLKTHPRIGEVIVVSDGSTDATVQQAKSAHARVIALKKNVGKGGAMAKGVAAAKHDIVAFFDADIVGLNHRIVNRMLNPVLYGDYDMFTLIRDRRSEIQFYISEAFVIGGERVLRKHVWSLVPSEDRKGFQVELALNYYALKAGCKVGSAFVKGLMQVIKEKKHGLWLGFWYRLRMIVDCIAAIGKLHLLSALRTS